MKIVPYSDYKPSDSEWLDQLPEAWDELSCRAIVEHVVEKNHDGKVQNYLSLMANVGVIPYEDKGDVGNKKPDDLTKCKVVSVGDLVINSMNYAIGSYGMSPYYGVCSPVYVILRPDHNKIDQQFALRIFQNPTFQKYIASFGNGILAHRAAIGWEDIKNAKVPVPSVHEQTQISTFLDRETAKIDRLIEKQQRLIKLLEEKRQAVISHAVIKGLNPDAPMKDSGVEWLGEVPKHWSLPKLVQITLKIGDGLHSTPEYEDGTGYYFVNGNNLNGEEIILTDATKEVAVTQYHKHFIPLGNNSLLLSINGTIGNTALFNDESVILGKSAAYINCGFDICRRYLMYYLQSNNLKHFFDLEVTGTTIFNLSLNSIRQMKVCLPPKEEQHQIVGHCKTQIQKYKALSSRVKRAIELLKERRIALISAAVTGKIDVRDQVPQDVEEAVAS